MQTFAYGDSGGAALHGEKKEGKKKPLKISAAYLALCS